MKKIILSLMGAIIVFTALFVFPYESFYINNVEIENQTGKSDEVKNGQQRLKNWGYFKGDVNGNIGLDTINALLAYQKSNNLYPSKRFDGDTLNSMGMSSYAYPGYAYGAVKATPAQLLARAINGEARGEPYEGQVAVGAVILNRTKSSKFPKTIAGVIYQPGAFTAVSDGQINVPLSEKSTVTRAARDALNGWDPTSGCIYYWNPATATSKWIWSRQIVKKIGKHNFGK